MVDETGYMRRIRAIVSGRVQGVSYRASTVTVARRMGLTGWVRNLEDGSVEVVAQGPEELVEKLVEWCRHGPPAAEVTSVTVEELTRTSDGRDFDIVH